MARIKGDSVRPHPPWRSCFAGRQTSHNTSTQASGRGGSKWVDSKEWSTQDENSKRQIHGAGAPTSTNLSRRSPLRFVDVLSAGTIYAMLARGWPFHGHGQKDWRQNEMSPKEVNWEEESKRFDEASEYYDTFRPSYPTQLIDCIVEKTAIPFGARILEIGSGSGKATKLFVKRGFELLCVEPGENLVAVGQKKFKDSKVKFITTRFENWEYIPEYFDLALSAQAFHWVPKPVGFEKCARALKPNCFLALFWNMYLCGSGKINEQLSDICKNYNVLPMLSSQECEKRISNNCEEILSSGFFTSPLVYRYPWNHCYNFDQFLGFLMTGNGYLGLEIEKKLELKNKLKNLFEKAQNAITMSYLCVLYLSKKVE